MFRINSIPGFNRVQPLNSARQPAVQRDGISRALMLSLPVVWGTGCEASQMSFGAAGVFVCISAVAFWKSRQPTPPRPTRPLSDSLRLHLALTAYGQPSTLAGDDFEGDSPARPMGRVVDMVDLGGNCYVCPEDVVSKNLDTQSGNSSVLPGATVFHKHLLPGKK